MTEAKTIPAKYIFLDIVSFTLNRSAEAQSHIVEVLNHIVEKSILEHGISKEKVLFLPAGDGMCISLLNVISPYDIHLLIALSIVREVHIYSAATKDEMRRFEVRVGLNSHIDNLITDINGHQNIAGAGVNLASRVMLLADGNQILVSKPVFETLRYHEKYISSFDSFRAEVKHGLELPAYQFTGKGFEGLNTSVPSYFQDAEQIESPTDEETFHKKSARRSPAGKQDAGEQLNATWNPQPGAGQTQSYLKGILPEPMQAETTTGWIKSKSAKTETLNFLEQAEEPKQNRSFIWAAMILLLVGGSLGTWFWMRQQKSSTANTAPVSTISATPSETPSNPTPVPSQTPTQAVAETVAPAKPNLMYSQKPAPVETASKSTIEPSSRTRSTVKRLTIQRPLILRTVAQRPQPKRQTVKAEKPKPYEKLTIEDLINNN